METIRRILEGNLGLAPDEKLAVVADASMQAMAEQFTAGAAALGAKGSVFDLSRGGIPEEAAGLLAETDVILVLGAQPAWASRKSLGKILAKGARGADLTGATWDMMERLMDVDPEVVFRKVQDLADLLRGGRAFRLAGAGTDLAFTARDPVPGMELGDYRQPGSFGELPAGEVRIQPVPETLCGAIAVHEMFLKGEPAGGPCSVTFEKGRVVRIDPPAAAEDLATLAAKSRSWRIGFGAHPRAIVGGHPVEDRKAVGAAHAVSEDESVCLVFLPEALSLDGTPVAWKPAVAPVADAPDLAGVKTFLLEHSMDAQYVLDARTQEFLYVNRAFELLQGYTLAELRARRITGERLIAPEEREAVRQRFARDAGADDRYGFVAVTRTGRRISLEVSVRRVEHGGRKLALGVAREVTEQKRMEKRLREEVDLQRHQTLGAYQANVRIYQLTEKIRAAYESTRNILKCRTLDEMAKNVVEILCDAGGLNYKVARFYHVDGRWLRRLAASDEKTKKVIDLRKSHRLARIARGESPPEESGDAQVIPLRSRDETVGLLVLSGRADEKARIWQDNIVMTLAGLISLMIDNLALYEKVRAQTIVDPLTRVFNRRHFDEKLVAEFRRAVRYKRELSLAMIDIDDFKRINDTYGHPQGDVVLREVAKILGSWTRSTDFVFRYGGEEFTLLLPETSPENALVKVEGLRALIEGTVFPNLVDAAKPFRVTVSIGLAGVGLDVASAEALVRVADEALYRAKREGKNRTVRAVPPPAA